MSTQLEPAAVRDVADVEAAALTRPKLPRSALITGLAALAWLGSAALTQWWPAADEWPYTGQFIVFKVVLAAFAIAIAALGWRTGVDGTREVRNATSGSRVETWVRAMPWLLALALGISAWEVLTAQLEWLPRPFFAPPQALIGVFAEDNPRLGSSVAHSFGLLACGYVLGAVTGFVTGVSIGWSKAVSYWVHPVLRLIGPLPSTAWLPLAFFFFPSSFSASVFLIALATAFPVTVLTWSGVASVNSAYYDIARTLGARPGFLILRVAIPAALPSVFVGLFMGLGASFSVLIVAEMMGVKAGLGWYLQWAQGWAAYANMYAALLVMALMCSGLITLLFRVRDRLLGWQKGLLKW
ncbi:ABC transporter permease [Paraburkholderia phenazinium]|uniref:NitT/TauT family transport system permease protein n=1 Tax=Paraburkholderia phenazinium TaxID=60549 RepID=A0A1G7S1X0_9BURK|nr:ABC transporter permease subunit [Paraburkholderia phenazinium]SDG17012.1 NitT/TauT family transport system permease protein [Paraburkholderia phenazinium]